MQKVLIENLLVMTEEGVAALVGDKSYDSNAFIQTLTEKGIEPVIPPRSNRINTRDCDWFVYKELHLIECFFNKAPRRKRRGIKYALQAAGFYQLTSQGEIEFEEIKIGA